MPARPEPFTQFQSHSRMTHNIEDVSCLHAVLCHDPEPMADARVANRSAASLPGLATAGFEQRIPRRRDAYCKQQLNRRIEHVFLQRVNNLVFHFCYHGPSAVYANLLYAMESARPKERFA